MVTQKELFKEFEEPKKKKRRPDSILPKNYALFNVTYEHVIFISIAVIMLMVFLFSLGVERGRRLIPQEDRGEVVGQETITKGADLQKESAGSEDTGALVAAKESAEEIKVVNSRLFTIQVIAYRSKRLAQEELVRLGKKGYKPFIIVGGNYYQICVGGYSDKNEAEKDLSELKKAYRDSFVRKR